MSINTLEEKPSILIVDDGENFRERLAMGFEDRGWQVYTAADGLSALQVTKENNPEHVILDLKMPGPSGIEVLKNILAHDPATQVVILTGYGSIATAIEATKLGAKHYLTKPVDMDDILKAFDAPITESSAKLGKTPSLARTEWEHIQRVLQDCDGNISEAARRLKIHRRSLQRKLSKHPPKS